MDELHYKETILIGGSFLMNFGTEFIAYSWSHAVRWMIGSVVPWPGFHSGPGPGPVL